MSRSTSWRSLSPSAIAPFSPSSKIAIVRHQKWPYNLPMQEEELERRSAELKARMLAQRNVDARKRPTGAAIRDARSTVRQVDTVAVPDGGKSAERAEVAALKMRISELEAENKSLRRQLASTNYQAPLPSRASGDSVREQRHNFFKYSNLRRY